MEPVLVTTSGHIASAWSVDFKDALVSDGEGGYVPVDIADRYLADVQTNPGNSGGPAFALLDGTVVGMLVQTRLASLEGLPNKTPADIGVLIPSTTIVSFAAQRDVTIPTIT